MKTIGLVTIVDYKNYGNRLQNYAAQETLKSLGCEVTTIVNKPIKRKNDTKDRNLMDKLKGVTLKDLSVKIKNRMNRRQYLLAFDKKVNAFKAFSQEYITESDFTVAVDAVPDDLGERFDYFVVGSDQVWNPTYRKGSSIDFLTFAPSEKRIAYAPSFGVSTIPDEFKVDYKEWLAAFKALSVREDAGAEIIKSLTGREAEVLVDPTVMLTKEEWLKIAKPHHLKPNHPYLLTYFLGEVPKEVKALIQALAKDNNLEVVNLGSYDQIKRYDVDPNAFIDYVEGSAIFLTDSFHGAVFSIIFEKQFIVFDRVSKTSSMHSRIDTLLAKFNLRDRKWDQIKQSKDYFGASFMHTGPKFEEERSKGYDYLKHVLDIKDAE